MAEHQFYHKTSNRTDSVAFSLQETMITVCHKYSGNSPNPISQTNDVTNKDRRWDSSLATRDYVYYGPYKLFVLAINNHLFSVSAVSLSFTSVRMLLVMLT